MNTGFTMEGFPSFGAWVTYALGTENQELPAFVAINDPRGLARSGKNNFGNGFLPAAFQGTDFSAKSPPNNLDRPNSLSANANRGTVELLKRLNAKHLEKYPGDANLAGRIASYELAGRMQTSVPEVMDLTGESFVLVRPPRSGERGDRTGWTRDWRFKRLNNGSLSGGSAASLAYAGGGPRAARFAARILGYGHRRLGRSGWRIDRLSNFSLPTSPFGGAAAFHALRRGRHPGAAAVVPAVVHARRAFGLHFFPCCQPRRSFRSQPQPFRWNVNSGSAATGYHSPSVTSFVAAASFSASGSCSSSDHNPLSPCGDT